MSEEKLALQCLLATKSQAGAVCPALLSECEAKRKTSATPDQDCGNLRQPAQETSSPLRQVQCVKLDASGVLIEAVSQGGYGHDAPLHSA